MSEATIDRMARELATARRWATTLAERVWHLEDAIDLHRKRITGPVSADLELYDRRDTDV